MFMRLLLDLRKAQGDSSIRRLMDKVQAVRAIPPCPTCSSERYAAPLQVRPGVPHNSIICDHCGRVEEFPE